jgi:paraquat-inducible protein A
MVEVYLLGLMVAYVKLDRLVHLELGAAAYALCALMLTMVAADATLDRQLVWEALEHQRRHDARESAGPPSRAEASIGCELCGFLATPWAGCPARCARCGARLRRRKPDSVGRTCALLAAAAILYAPANIYPVLTVTQLGAGVPSTILGGVLDLLSSGMYPLAALVFCASIVVPMLKLMALSMMLVTTWHGSTHRLRERTVAYRFVMTIGRWSMIDVFMASILVALVHFGALTNISSGSGAVAFAAVVILTMLAAETFDPRLMWDAAGMQKETTP